VLGLGVQGLARGVLSREAAVKGWAEQTPANFEFAVKGGQVLTAEEQGQKLLVFTATPGTDELAT